MKERLRLALPHTVLLLVAGLLYYATTFIDTSGSGGTRLGPDFWPQIIVAAMAALCIYEIGKRLIVGATRDAAGLTVGLVPVPLEAEGAPVAPEAPPSGERRAAPSSTCAPVGGGRAATGGAAHIRNRKLAGGLLLIAAFVLGVAYIGFFIGTALFLALFSWIGGYRRALPVALVSVIGAFVLLVIFMRVAYVSLPLGVGPFQDVSVWLLRLMGV